MAITRNYSNESDIQDRRKELDGLEKDLASRNINFDVIKTNQTKLLQQYKQDWKNSWRSWSLFKDDTRESHMDVLQNHINDLRISTLIQYLSILENEKGYAIAQHGTKYTSAIEKMQADFKSHFNRVEQELLNKMIWIKAEIERMIAKQNGEERFNQTLANLTQFTNASKNTWRS